MILARFSLLPWHSYGRRADAGGGCTSGA